MGNGQVGGEGEVVIPAKSSKLCRVSFIPEDQVPRIQQQQYATMPTIRTALSSGLLLLVSWKKGLALKLRFPFIVLCVCVCRCAATSYTPRSYRESACHRHHHHPLPPPPTWLVCSVRPGRMNGKFTQKRTILLPRMRGRGDTFFELGARTLGAYHFTVRALEKWSLGAFCEFDEFDVRHVIMRRAFFALVFL